MAAINAGTAMVKAYLDGTALEAGLSRAQAKLRAFSAGIAEIGRGLMAFSALGAVPLILGAKTFADFDRQMAMVSTMLDEPDKHMKRFSEGIRRMSVQFGEDTATLSKGLYDLLSASVAPENALHVLEIAVKAARGGMTDTATATAAMVNVLNAFHIPANRANEVADTLFKTVKRGVLNFEQLAGSVGNVTAMASAAGLSFDEVGAAIATMTRNGLNAETSVIALQTILKSFLAPTDANAKLAKKLGIELNLAGLKAGGLLGVMRKLETVSPENIAKVFSEARALRGIYALRGDVAGLATDMEQMSHKAGAAQEAYQRMAGRLGGIFNRIRQAIKMTFSAIGEAIAPTLIRWGNEIIPVISGTARWISQNKELLATVMKWTVAIGAAGAALLGLAAAIRAIAFTLLPLKLALSVAGSALSVIPALVGAIGTAFTMLATPVGVIVAGVLMIAGALAYTTGYGAKLIKWFGDNLAWLGNVFGNLQSDALATFQGIKDAMVAGNFGLAARILWLAVKMEFMEFAGWAYEWWVAFKDVFFGAWEAIKANALTFINNIVGAFQAGFAIIGGFFSKLMVAPLQMALDAMMKLMTGRWRMMLELADYVPGIDTKPILKALDDLQSGASEKIMSTLTAGQKAKLAAVNADTQRRLAEIGGENIGVNEQIQIARDKANAGRQTQYQQDLADMQARVDAARDEWRGSIQQAAEERKQAEMPQAPVEPGKPKLEQQLPDFQTAIQEAADKMEANVSFAGWRTAGLGLGTTAQDRTAKASEETAKNTRDIKNSIEDLEGEFV